MLVKYLIAINHQVLSMCIAMGAVIGSHMVHMGDEHTLPVLLLPLLMRPSGSRETQGGQGCSRGVARRGQLGAEGLLPCTQSRGKHSVYMKGTFDMSEYAR